MAPVHFPVQGVRWTMEELKDLLRAKLDDHDLLIELRALFNALAAQILKTNDDHERRLRAVETRIVYLWGALGLGGGAGAVAAFKMLGGKFGA